MSVFLGIDVGTQSVKALCFDTDKRAVVAQSSSALELDSRDDGTREQLAQWWVTALRSCLNEIDSDTRKLISAIGVSGQQHGFVPLAADGSVLAPVKLWCDTATLSQCEQITEAFGGADKCIRETGNPVLPGYTSPKILWLKQNHPDLYDRLDTILLPHDYINFYLTGEKVMECGDASGTGLLDVRNRSWHPGMLAAVDSERDLSECLPSLVSPENFIGKVLPEIASDLGIPAGTPVSAGGGDNMMAAIGTGNIAPGRLTISLGTSGTLFAYSEKPIVDPEGSLAAFCDSTGSWLPLLCTMNCTVATELTRKMLGMSLKELDREISDIPPGSGGVITLPFFQGERTPNLPRGQGCIFGLNQANYSSGNLLRSAMESAVFGLRAGLDRFIDLGCDIESIRLTGGGASSAVWRQIVADVFDLPVTVQKNDEGAALGAALQAAWVYEKSHSGKAELRDLVDAALELDQSKCCDPIEQHVQVYKEQYQRYQSYLATVTPLYQ
ncbi:MAG: xylulokinase [Porticoccaceae bacterium]